MLDEDDVLEILTLILFFFSIFIHYLFNVKQIVLIINNFLSVLNTN
jgi:hypothetical protein